MYINQICTALEQYCTVIDVMQHTCVGVVKYVARMPDLRFGDPQFKSCFDHQLVFLQVVSSSISWLCLYIASWSASCQLRFLTHSVNWLYSVTIYQLGPHQSMSANFLPTHQIKYHYHYCYCYIALVILIALK